MKKLLLSLALLVISSMAFSQTVSNADFEDALNTYAWKELTDKGAGVFYGITTVEYTHLYQGGNAEYTIPILYENKGDSYIITITYPEMDSDVLTKFIDDGGYMSKQAAKRFADYDYTLGRNGNYPTLVLKKSYDKGAREIVKNKLMLKGILGMWMMSAAEHLTEVK